MNKTKDIDQIFNQWQIWSDSILSEYGGRSFHYSLEEGGFCPKYLGKDFGFGIGALPVNADGSGGRQDYVPFTIQQIKSEIYNFVDFLLKNQYTESFLEIGLGDFGGNHFLMSQFFDSVTTIEYSTTVIDRFKKNSYKPEYQGILNRSTLINSDSNSVDLTALRELVFDNSSVQVLFIDGNHTYHGCKNDFDKYYPVVKSGGIVAFHDSHSQKMGYGCVQFIDSLRDKFDMVDIWDLEAEAGGISYFIKS